MSRAKPPKDPRGGHARLYWSILDSPAWRTLTHADVRVYLALRRKLGRTNNGDINATLAEMKHAGISSSSTLSAALHRLEALGFIEKTRQGGIAHGGKLCSLYRFTDEPTYDIAKAGVRAGPASNEWQRFQNMAEARAAVRIFSRKNKAKIRTSARSGAIIESDSAVCDSTIKHAPKSPTRPSSRKDVEQNGLQPA
jgi:predicted transcriptional regulator